MRSHRDGVRGMGQFRGLSYGAYRESSQSGRRFNRRRGALGHGVGGMEGGGAEKDARIIGGRMYPVETG